MSQANPTTERMYGAAEADFHAWCRDEGRTMPIAHRDLAGYLRGVLRQRGPNSVPVYLAALGRLYRRNGHPLDPKAMPIQDVLRDARADRERVSRRVAQR